MDPRMDMTRNSQRELRMLRAQEDIAASLQGILQVLMMWYSKMYEEDCAEEINRFMESPNAEVVMKRVES